MSSTARSLLSQMMSKNVVSKFTWMGVADDKLSFFKHGLKLVLIECLVLLHPAETGHQGQISKSIGQWFTQFSAEEQETKEKRRKRPRASKSRQHKVEKRRRRQSSSSHSTSNCSSVKSEALADLSEAGSTP
nr:PREDICTED: uncharacterized protein LOC109036987 [Bemisia tabaci]